MVASRLRRPLHQVRASTPAGGRVRQGQNVVVRLDKKKELHRSGLVRPEKIMQPPGIEPGSPAPRQAEYRRIVYRQEINFLRCNVCHRVWQAGILPLDHGCFATAKAASHSYHPRWRCTREPFASHVINVTGRIHGGRMYYCEVIFLSRITKFYMGL